MLTIAVTGGIASGKSTVADILHTQYNIPVIDSDQIARNIVQPGSELLNKITNKFGTFVLNPDNSLNRPKLREIIFNNKPDRIWLENLLHPVINQEIQNQINYFKSQNNYKYILVQIPLITKEYLENNKFIDKVLVVISSKENQLKRAQSRDKQDISNIENIINNQISDQERLEFADYVIKNDATLDKLEEAIANFYIDIKKYT